MRYIELLKANKTFLQLLKRNGVVIADVEMIDIYEQYVEMSKSEDKRTYINEVVANKAGITTRTLYHIVKRMEQEIDI